MTKTIKFLSLPLLVLLLFTFSCERDDDDDDDSLTDTLIENPEVCLVEIDGSFVLVDLDSEPEFIDGGERGFVNAFYDVIKYPAEARENGVQGTVILSYEITKEGSLENIIIIQDIGAGCGEESKRALDEATPGVSFEPGIFEGNPVRVKKSIPIKFKLQ